MTNSTNNVVFLVILSKVKNLHCMSIALWPLEDQRSEEAWQQVGFVFCAHSPSKLRRVGSADDVSKKSDDMGMKVANLDDYMELAKKSVEKLKTEGVVGLKTAARPNEPPDRKAAEEIFKKIMSSTEQKRNYCLCFE